MKQLFADGAYDRLKLMDKAAHLDFVIEIIRRSNDQKGFQVLTCRWVAERTFGLMTRWRRLVRHYERRIDVSQATITVAMGGNFSQPVPVARLYPSASQSDLFTSTCCQDYRAGTSVAPRWICACAAVLAIAIENNRRAGRYFLEKAKSRQLAGNQRRIA